MARKRTPLLAAPICGLLRTARAGTNAGQPVRTGSEQGYPDGGNRLSHIPPDQRTVRPPVSGSAPGCDQVGSTQDCAGQVMVINVWGSGCGPCRNEAPDRQAASTETSEIARFLGITSKDYDPAPAEAFVRAFKITYPSLDDPTGTTLLAFAGQGDHHHPEDPADHQPALGQGLAGGARNQAISGLRRPQLTGMPIGGSLPVVVDQLLVTGAWGSVTATVRQWAASFETVIS